MELHHDFTVPVPVDEAWRTLLDIERVAPCMPGATVDEFDGTTVTGSVKVKVGPITVTYKGTAVFEERDDAAHRMVLVASGRETRGQGTARALRRHGIRMPLTPSLSQQDSEGLLEHPALHDLHGRRVGLIGAAGGRGLLRERMGARGAQLHEVHVYRRVPPRLDRRHVDALLQLPSSARLLLSSAEALHNLHRRLPPAAWARLRAATAVVSSGRLATIARDSGFSRIVLATSALPADLLDAAMRAG